MKEEALERIDNALCHIFRDIPILRYPLDLDEVMRLFPHCRTISYSQLASVNHCTHKEIIQSCKSYDGCTNYDPATGRYLICINYSQQYSIPFRRIRWTRAHELGHIVCGHFEELERAGLHGASPSDFNEYEEEADYFASCLLAPLPALKSFDLKSPDEIWKYLLISHQAAEYSWSGLKRYRDHQESYPPKAERLLKRYHVVLRRIQATTLHQEKAVREYLERL